MTQTQNKDSKISKQSSRVREPLVRTKGFDSLIGAKTATRIDFMVLVNKFVVAPKWQNYKFVTPIFIENNSVTLLIIFEKQINSKLLFKTEEAYTMTGLMNTIMHGFLLHISKHDPDAYTRDYNDDMTLLREEWTATRQNNTLPAFVDILYTRLLLTERSMADQD